MEQTPHTSIESKLAALEAGREALLKRAVEILRNDPRVMAAWLSGSLGRGTADEWSDIDLWVVVADNHITEVSAARRAYVAKLSEPLLIVDAPQNAPAGGAFLTVLYRGDVGSHHVDWTWQRQSDAQVPPDALLLFDKVGLPMAAPPPSALQTVERAEKARHQTAYFWMMVPVVAKYIARRRLWGAVNLLNMLRYALQEIAELAGQSDDSPLYPANHTLSPPGELFAQLHLLRKMCEEMERLMSKEPKLEREVSIEARQQLMRHLNMAEAVIGEPLR